MMLTAATTTGAALLENNEGAAKLTTANGGTFTWAQLDSVANHVTARSIGDWRALTWLATATGEFDVNVPPFAVVSLSVSTWFDTTWIGGTASRLYMCKSVATTQTYVCVCVCVVSGCSWQVEFSVWNLLARRLLHNSAVARCYLSQPQLARSVSNTLQYCSLCTRTILILFLVIKSFLTWDVHGAERGCLTDH